MKELCCTDRYALSRQLAEVANTLSAMQPEIMAQLVPLERKLGLVVTLFRVSCLASTIESESHKAKTVLYGCVV